jgi:hypothetical protein
MYNFIILLLVLYGCGTHMNGRKYTEGILTVEYQENLNLTETRRKLHSAELHQMMIYQGRDGNVMQTGEKRNAYKLLI